MDHPSGANQLGNGDMPVGLGMQLSQDPRAMENFAWLPDEQKHAILAEIQSCGTGDEARECIRRVVARLHNNQI